MADSSVPTFHVVIRAGADGAPHYEVKWRSRVMPGRQMKRRIGPAWLDADGAAWTPRKGRPGPGDYNERAATVRAAEIVQQVEASLTDEALEAARDAAKPLTFRVVAGEWIADLETQRRKPQTIANYRTYLREPGTPHKRGGGQSPGHLMRVFGDLDVRDVTAKQVGAFLRKLDTDGMSPRSINEYRKILSCVFEFACREDTHGLASNPVAKVRRWREPPTAPLAFYEGEEVEAIAGALAAGAHRTPSSADYQASELLARAEEDARDASFVRVLLYTGMRLSEVRALRWAEVDIDGETIVVRRNVSAGVVVDTPKGGRERIVALPAVAVEELRKLAGRQDFTSPGDLVFGGRLGDLLDDSALRKRYKAAVKVAGLRPVRLHGLRTAHASLLSRAAQPSMVRDQLGHAKQTTTDRYVGARITPEFRAQLDATFPSSGAGAPDDDD